MGPDGPCDPFGPIFKPNGRFWTHLGPNLMLLGPAATLAGTWQALCCFVLLPQGLSLGDGPPVDLTSPVAANQLAAGAFFSENSNPGFEQALLVLASLPQALFSVRNQQSRI